MGHLWITKIFLRAKIWQCIDSKNVQFLWRYSVGIYFVRRDTACSPYQYCKNKTPIRHSENKNVMQLKPSESEVKAARFKTA